MLTESHNEYGGLTLRENGRMLRIMRKEKKKQRKINGNFRHK